MAIIPMDKEKHINKGWIPFKDLSFAKKNDDIAGYML